MDAVRCRRCGAKAARHPFSGWLCGSCWWSKVGRRKPKPAHWKPPECTTTFRDRKPGGRDQDNPLFENVVRLIEDGGSEDG